MRGFKKWVVKDCQINLHFWKTNMERSMDITLSMTAEIIPQNG